MKRLVPYIIVIASLLISCTKERGMEDGVLSITSEIVSFKGDVDTKANLAGSEFETNDWMRMKIICPFSNAPQRGETDGNQGGFWLFQWNGSSWVRMSSNQGCDLNGDFTPSNAYDLQSTYQVQSTPYVFTANTWCREKVFKAGNGSLYDQYSTVFFADQSKRNNYKDSDILWAQLIKQTGSWDIHLSFQHVMSAILFTIDDSALTDKITRGAVLTVDNMPAIDQEEVLVGDYYAAKDKNNTAFGYKQKNQCDVSMNGKVIGIASNSATSATCVPLSSIPNTQTYKAYEVSAKTFRLIVPPVTLSSTSNVMIVQGSKRYSVALPVTSFEPGVLYNIPITLTEQK